MKFDVELFERTTIRPRFLDYPLYVSPAVKERFDAGKVEKLFESLKDIARGIKVGGFDLYRNPDPHWVVDTECRPDIFGVTMQPKPEPFFIALNNDIQKNARIMCEVIKARRPKEALELIFDFGLASLRGAPRPPAGQEG